MHQQYEDMSENSFAFEATKGIHEADALANRFFSIENLNALQHGLRYGVYKQSGGKHVIDNQSERDLKAIMRDTYMNHATNRMFAIDDEIRHLNGIILNQCVPKIIQEIEAYQKYLHDSTHSPNFMNRYESTSIKGTKSLEMKPFF